MEITDKNYILAKLNKLYQNKRIESTLEKHHFIDLFKKAVKDSFPRVKENYAGQSIYGISFEIANIVQRVFADDYYTILYLNTEEMYQEATKDCEDEEEKSYYRFTAWSEWDVADITSPFFQELQDYLLKNCLKNCLDLSEDLKKELESSLKEWYTEMEYEIDDAYEKERKDIRMWMAQALGELRKENFWDQQGLPNIYVIPFEGECDIDHEEMILTFQEMDQGYHDSEYLDYLESME